MTNVEWRINDEARMKKMELYPLGRYSLFGFRYLVNSCSLVSIRG
jgi:hypothetical protein